MPSLAIIPSRAVRDENLSDTQVRVLCAIGTFTNKLGGNVWASIRTLAAQSNLSERTVQRALPALVKYGYVRRVERSGRTSVYEVLLERTPDTGVGGGGDTPDGGGVTAESPERYTTSTTQEPKRKKSGEYTEQETAVFNHLFGRFPKRETPHPYIPARKAVVVLLRQGIPAHTLMDALDQYADQCERDKTAPKYVKSMHGFYTDDYWRAFTTVRVYGRTREEWARSGQDVAEFDRLAAAVECE